jgi:succinate dehydrogenase / fumarate reductase cytochrome b subunit
MNKPRPKHLSLYQIKLPVPGIVSILHRVSGVVLFCALPLLLLMLQSSLRSVETYTRLMDVFANPLVKSMLSVLLWAFLHHFFAGLRYLAVDVHLLRGLAQARSSSMAVIAMSLALTVVIGTRIW